MTKFHINKHGVPAPCKAKKGNCPYGGESGNENHFETEREAQKFADELNESKFGIINGINEVEKSSELLNNEEETSKLDEVIDNSLVEEKEELLWQAEEKEELLWHVQENGEILRISRSEAEEKNIEPMSWGEAEKVSNSIYEKEFSKANGIDFDVENMTSIEEQNAYLSRGFDENGIAPGPHRAKREELDYHINSYLGGSYVGKIEEAKRKLMSGFGEKNEVVILQKPRKTFFGLKIKYKKGVLLERITMPGDGPSYKRKTMYRISYLNEKGVRNKIREYAEADIGSTSALGMSNIIK